jgi:hypothetical protein
MLEIHSASVGALDPAQAGELSLLVDLEARWENLRKTSPPPRSGVQDLQARQRAYDSFHSRLVAYNRQYTPAHVPELLLNTPARLALWCRKMRDLYQQVDHGPQGHCPIHLLEKAYRWADHVGTLLNKELPVRPAAPPSTLRDAIAALEALVQWCDDQASVSVSA